MPTQIEPATLRAAMSRFPTGVTVVTAIGPAGPAGATANAVASLSLEPPLMLACLDLGSRTLVAVEHARRFGVNVLAGDQAELARRFSTKDPHPEKWDGVAWEERAGTPRIDGALIWLGLRAARRPRRRRPRRSPPGGCSSSSESDGEPLIFHHGEYRPLTRYGGAGR